MGSTHVNFLRALRRMQAPLLAAIAAIALTCSCGTHRASVVKGTKTTASTGKTGGKTQKLNVDGSLPAETQSLLREAAKWLGTSYRYGGTTRSGVDCSGLVLNLFNTALSIKLPRNSAAQQEYCARISRNDLVEGDLVFFTTGGGKRVNHVGMYVGDGNIIHSSTSRGVIISSLSEDYYRRTFHSAGRVEKYYAMISGKSGKKKKGSDKTRQENPSIERIVEDVLYAATKTTPATSTEATEQTAARRTAVTAVATVAVESLGKVLAKSAEKKEIKDDVIAAAKEAEGLRMVRRKLLDETLDQAVDSIVSEYFD